MPAWYPRMFMAAGPAGLGPIKHVRLLTSLHGLDDHEPLGDLSERAAADGDVEADDVPSL